MSTWNHNFIEIQCRQSRICFNRCFMDVICSVKMVQCVIGGLEMKMTFIYPLYFGGKWLLEYSSNPSTIAPRMVLFHLKCNPYLARASTMITVDINTFQRWPIFLDWNHTKQHSVQNWVIWVQFKFNLHSLQWLLEYLLIWGNMDVDGYLEMYQLLCIWLACILIIYVSIRKIFCHTQSPNDNLQCNKQCDNARMNEQNRKSTTMFNRWKVVRKCFCPLNSTCTPLIRVNIV